MTLADQCRTLATQCLAASLNPLAAPRDRAVIARLAEQYEAMAGEFDRQSILTATDADLDALSLAFFGQTLPRDDNRRLAS